MITWLKKITTRINVQVAGVSIVTVSSEINSDNTLDRNWANFLLDKNPAWLKTLSHNACEAPQHIATSEIFGQNIQAFQDALSAFHLGADDAFAELTERLRKVSSTYRAQLAQLALLANPVNEYAVDALVVGTELNGLVVTDNLLNSFYLYLEADAAQKVRLLDSSSVYPLSLAHDDARLHGTLLVDVPFIGVSIGAQRAFFLSLQSPLDAIYFPSHRVIVHASALRFACTDRLSKLFNWILRNLELYQAFWQQSATSQLRYLVRDKRPYHVLLDELSGRYELQEAGITLPTVFFERASFIEGAETIGFTRPEHHIFEDVLVSNHYRADKDLFSKRYFHYLAKEAEQRYGLPDSASKGVIIWLSVSGGEKRRWFEESDALIAFVRWAHERFGACHFYVDGWTGPQVKSASDEQQIAQHKQIWEQVRQASQLQSTDFTLFIGASILRKIWAAAQAQFFISCAGTPSVWPSLISRVPGVVHNSVSMIRRVQNTYYPDNVVRVADEQIVDINEIGDKIRWDKYSYSIHVKDFLNCADQAYERALGCRKPEQFYKALVTARKSGNERWLQALTTLCQERLATYRNLPHLLESSAFFGSPEVEILAEEEGNYRLIDCNVGCQSDVVFITFGKVSSHVDHIPFAYPFLGRSGFKHLHVAQARKTSYQKLSFERFAELLQPLVKDYRYRITYGPGLGGYAALYYAPAIRAHAIAGSPRLPLHPENEKFRGTLWQPGSHWDEASYKHLPLSRLATTMCPEPFIIFDPDDVIDGNFIKHCIEPYFVSIRFLEVPGSKHGSLMKLSRSGKLKDLILEYVASIRGQQ